MWTNINQAFKEKNANSNNSHKKININIIIFGSKLILSKKLK